MRHRFSLIMFFLIIPYLAFAQHDTIFNQTDKRNLKQGYWKKTYPNGNLMYKAFFVNDKPVGELVRYYESGQIRAKMNYDQKSEKARTELYYENGNLAATGNYLNALKDSIWTYYSFYSKTITARESWSKGVRHGMMISYFENGDISEKLEWNNNRKSGIWEQYFKGNVLKMKAHYENNKLEGEFVVYTIKSTPYIRGNYVNNLREGKWIFYDETGNVQQELNYRAGVAAESEKLNAEQQEFFRNIDEAQGKYKEPDETDFLQPSRPR